MLENLPTDPIQWVQAFEAMSGVSKAAFWIFVIAVALRIGGDKLALLIGALRGRR